MKNSYYYYVCLSFCQLIQKTKNFHYFLLTKKMLAKENVRRFIRRHFPLENSTNLLSSKRNYIEVFSLSTYLVLCLLCERRFQILTNDLFTFRLAFHILIFFPTHYRNVLHHKAIFNLLYFNVPKAYFRLISSLTNNMQCYMTEYLHF